MVSTNVLIEDCTVAVGSAFGAPTYLRMTELSLLVVVIVPQLEVIKNPVVVDELLAVKIKG